MPAYGGNRRVKGLRREEVAHRSGRKRLRHPAVGQLDLDFEAMELPSEPGLQLNIYTAAAGTPASDGLKLLASWAAGRDDLPTEQVGVRLGHAPRTTPDP